MKGRSLKKLLAGFLAAVCLPLGSVTALAEIPQTSVIADEAEEVTLPYQEVNWARADGVTLTARRTENNQNLAEIDGALDTGSPLSKINDGVKDQNDQYGVIGSDGANRPSNYLEVDLGAVRSISKINMWRYNGYTYAGTVIALSKESTFTFGEGGNCKVIYNSDSENFHKIGAGVGSDEKYAETAAGRTFPVDSTNPNASYEARYIRVYMHGRMDGNSATGQNHIKELEVVGSVINWARADGVTLTARRTENNQNLAEIDGALDTGSPLSKINDGVKDQNDQYAVIGSDGANRPSNYLEVDLGAVRSISKINMWRYNGYTYAGTVIALSKESTFTFGEGGNCKVIYNSDSENFHKIGAGVGSDEKYAETAAGKTFPVDPTNPNASYEARYIRVYMHGRMDGNSATGQNHIKELEAIGNIVKAESVEVTAADNKTTLKPNETVQLSAEVLPESTIDKSVAWSSGDLNKATVSDTGLVTAAAAGDVTITATAKDGSGVSGTIDLTVTEPEEPGTDTEEPDVPVDPNPDSTVETELKDGKFTIGNEYISREFSIANNKLSTTKITNKRTEGEETIFTPAAGSEEFKIRTTKKQHPAIDKSGWSAVADSYQVNEVGSGKDGNGASLIDGDESTRWHTNYGGGTGATSAPYNVVFNLGKSTTFRCFSLMPRTDTALGRPKGYELYYSNSDNATTLGFEDASWTKLTEGEFFTAETYNQNKRAYVNLGSACTATQLKLKITSTYDHNYTAATEFDLHEQVKTDTVVPDTEREFVASDLTLAGVPVVESTEAEINSVKKKGKKVTFSFAPYTFTDPYTNEEIAYTINEVIVMYEGDHFMRKYLELSVPEDQRANAEIDYIDLESLKTNAGDAKWTIPTDQGGIVAMDQFKANLGQPIYIQGMFFGCEFPVADNEIAEDGTGYMRYYTGKSFDRLETDNQLTVDGKYVTWQTVAGAARSTENEVIQADFFEYIKSIATPSEFRIQYNSWFDNMMLIDDDNILESFIEIDREMSKAGVRPFDSYVVDDGWNNYNDTREVDVPRAGKGLNQTGFWEFNSKFPDGLTPSSELVKKFGSNFGVWVGPRGGYNFQGSLASIVTKSGKGSSAGGSVDVADREYVKNFTNMAVDWMEQYDVNYWKWDGFSDGGQYGSFAAEDGVPGYANRHMTGGYEHMYHVTDLWEAWIDLMERVRQCEKDEKINKLWISLTCYVNPSPWFLQWANSVWIQCVYDQTDAGPSSSKMDRQITYRDACYYDFLKRHDFQFPLSNLYNHDPVYGVEGTGMNKNTATDEQFQNYLYMLSTRGTAFWELYFSDSIMTDGKYEVTAEFLKWAEENYHMLRNSKMFGGSPDARTALNGTVEESGQNAYGFSCFDGKDGIISVRNAANAQKSVKITFDRTIGVPEDAGTLKYHMEHSHNLTAGTATTGEFVYGQEYTFTLQPDEVRIFRVSKSGDTSAPEIDRAYSDGEGTAVLKFNEKVKGGTFKINGQPATAEAGADDATIHLTAADGALTDADVMTVTAEGVTDLAGNALTDKERSFRYYADNVVAKSHTTVNREVVLARKRDSLTGTNGFSIKADILTGSTGKLIRQGEEYELGINANGTAYFVLNGLKVSSKKKVNDGYLHRIAGVKENNGMMKLYVDGSLEGSAYKQENMGYDIKAAKVVLGNKDFYGCVDARILNVAQGYDVMQREAGIVEEEPEEPDSEKNVALGKPVTAKWTDGSGDAPASNDRPLTMAVDGEKMNGTGNYAEFGSDADDKKKKSSYMQVDLGMVESISKINLYRYWSDGRKYGPTVVALSENAQFTNPTIAYNSDTQNVHGLGAGTDATYAESAEGKTFALAAPCEARYIRVYMCGRENSGGCNHIVELEVIQTPETPENPDTPPEETDADYHAASTAKALARFLLDNHTAHSDWYANEEADFTELDEARGAIQDGLTADRQEELDQTAADVFIAASKIQKTNKKKLHNILPEENDQQEVLNEYYTAESIAEYKEAVASARTVYAKNGATDEELKEALDNLSFAQEQLVTLEEKFAQIIAKANMVEKGSAFTDGEWTAFQNKLEEAEALLKRPLTAKDKGTVTDLTAQLISMGRLANLDVKVTEITVTAKGGKTSLNKGETVQLTADVKPAGADNRRVEWSSSSNATATVTQTGLVTALENGDVTITAKAKDGSNITGTISLKVEKVPVAVSDVIIGSSDVKIADGRATLVLGKAVRFTADVQPENADDRSVTWSIPESSKSVATLTQQDGVATVQGKAAGKVVLTATANGDKTQTDKVILTIKDIEPGTVPVESITAAATPTTLKVGGKATLTTTVSPANATNKEVEWQIEEGSDYAELEKTDDTWKLKAKAAGTVKVKAVAKDGSNVASNSVTVTIEAADPGDVPVESITAAATPAALKVGGKATLTATVSPANATNKEVEWQIGEGSEYAELENTNGTWRLKANAAGTVKVKAVAKDGSGVMSNSVTVTIEAADSGDVPVESITAAATPTTLKVGARATLTATVSPSNATNSEVEWQIEEGSEYAVLENTNGTWRLKANAAGTVKVKAVAKDGSGVTSNSVTVTIEAADPGVVLVESITAAADPSTLKIGARATLTATVSPSNATNSEVEWTIEEGSEYAKLENTSGRWRLRATGAGTVKVKAVAKDESQTESNIVTVTITDDEKTLDEVKEELKDALTDAGENYPDADEKNYPMGLWMKYKEALEAAQAAAEDSSSTKEQIEKAMQDLEDAINALESAEPGLAAAEQALNGTVINAQTKYPDSVKSKYTQASWENYKTALGKALALIGKTDSRKADVEQAKKDLEAAIAGLKLEQKKEDPAVTAARTQLGSAITSAEKKYPASAASKYTAASWNAFQSALKEAKRVRSLTTSTKTALDQARQRLEQAIKGLKPAQISNPVVQGGTYTVGNYTYKVTNLSAKTVEITGMLKAKVKTEKKIIIGNTVTLPDGAAYTIDSVGTGAFKKNTKATSIVIGKNVSKIGNSAFSGCKKVKTVTINSTKLTNIGKQAFAGCTKLGTVKIKSTKLKTIGKNAFKGIKKNATFKVPSKSLKKYKKLLTKKKIGQQVKVKK